MLSFLLQSTCFEGYFNVNRARQRTAQDARDMQYLFFIEKEWTC